MKRKVLKFISYIGSAGSLAALLATLISAVQIWLLHIHPTMDLMIGAIITTLVFMLPLKFSLRHGDDGSWDFKPIIRPNETVKIIVRLIALALVIGVITCFVVAFDMPKDKRNDASTYLAGIPLMSFLSYYCLVLYVFGLEVIYGEKVLAVSRHLYFLFNRNALRRYLRDKRKSEAGNQ